MRERSEDRSEWNAENKNVIAIQIECMIAPFVFWCGCYLNYWQLRLQAIYNLLIDNIMRRSRRSRARRKSRSRKAVSRLYLCLCLWFCLSLNWIVATYCIQRSEDETPLLGSVLSLSSSSLSSSADEDGTLSDGSEDDASGYESSSMSSYEDGIPNSVDIMTSLSILAFGLEQVGFSGRRQARVKSSTNVKRFKAHYGVGPQTVKALFDDLEALYPSLKFRDLLMTLNW